MKINKDLLPLKIHYFLRFAGVAFIMMVLPVIVKEKGVSPQGIGILWTTKYIAGSFVSSAVVTTAEYFRAHQAVFQLSIVLLAVGYVSTYALPPLPLEYDNAKIMLHNVSTPSNFTNDTLSNLSQEELPLTSTRPQTHSLTDLQSRINQELAVDDRKMTPKDAEVSAVAADPPEYMSMANLIKYQQFWFIFIALMVEEIGMNTVTMISDAVCFQILGTERHKYGQQRLWGTIGIGCLSLITGALVNLYSKGLPQVDYLPAVIICVVFMALDMIVVAKLDVRSSQKSKIKLGQVASVVLHPRSILFFITVFVMGVSMGLLWFFKFIYIDDVANAWDPSFSNLTLLQGIDMAIENFGGGVPFFFLSGMIIKRLGHDKVFICCISTFAIKCCLYSIVSNPWWFLPIEFLNGITFALFYACISSYASHLAPQGAQATLQALKEASFTVGMSTAGFLGGFLYQYIGGAKMYLSTGIFHAVYCAIFIICQFLITKYYKHQKSLDQASSNGLQNEHHEEKEDREVEEEKGEEGEEEGEEKVEEDTKKSLMACVKNME